MQVQVNTDNHVEGREKLLEHVEGVIRDAVDRHAEVVTHVEAHLGDVNSGGKSGPDDKRCMFEARVAGLKNIAVSPLGDYVAVYDDAGLNLVIFK